MPSSTYFQRREQLTTYFDHTAAAAWRALTSTDPVSRIRATVRAGRDEMRDTLVSWLPSDMSGQTLLDAGCGTGALAVKAAGQGARVVAVDVAASLIDVARRRAAREAPNADVDFRVGDMLSDALEEVDHVVAMDSLIHYSAEDVLQVVTRFARRARRSVLFTSAPWTPALGAMHFFGRLIPHQHHRAPAIEPVHTGRLLKDLNAALGPEGWETARAYRVTSGFYISQAIELRKTCAD